MRNYLKEAKLYKEFIISFSIKPMNLKGPLYMKILFHSHFSKKSIFL